jgi:Kef-type K+ transport system membrane component KefB
VSDASFVNLLVILVVAVAAPVLVASVPWLKVPSVVLELLAGIVLGPAVLGWIDLDELVRSMSMMGLVFLLFLAGLEIDLQRLRGPLLRLVTLGYLLTLVLGLILGSGLRRAGWVDSPVFVAVVLSATSLGLVVPVLKDSGQADRPVGQLVIAGATVADVAGVVLLSLFFSTSMGGAASRTLAVGAFVAVITASALALAGVTRSRRVDRLLVRLQDTTAEIRVRIAGAVLVGFVALAMTVGLETILGAFVAGAVMNAVDRPSATHPLFRVKLDAVGYGFLIPVFFVASGIGFDLASLTADPATTVRVPVLLAGLLAVRGLPALLYRRALGWRGSLVAGLLQATSLPFIVTAAAIGSALGAIDATTSAALVAAGLLSVVVFPLLALVLLDREPAGAGASGPGHQDVPDPAEPPTIVGPSLDGLPPTSAGAQPRCAPAAG